MFIKPIFGVYTSNGFMLQPLCAFISGGETSQSCVTIDSTKRAGFVAQSFWIGDCGLFSNNKGWGGCAGGINPCKIVVFSGATSFPNTGTKVLVWDFLHPMSWVWCWVTSCSDHPYIQPHLHVLSHISGGKMPFSPSPHFTHWRLPFWKLKRQKVLLFERVGKLI